MWPVAEKRRDGKKWSRQGLGEVSADGSFQIAVVATGGEPNGHETGRMGKCILVSCFHVNLGKNHVARRTIQRILGNSNQTTNMERFE